MKIKLWNFFVLLTFGLFCAATGVYGEHQAAVIRADALAERQAFVQALDSRRDLAAIGITDCGKLVLIQFIRRDGSKQIVPVPDGSHMGGLIARLARIPADRKNMLVNERPCL